MSGFSLLLSCPPDPNSSLKPAVNTGVAVEGRLAFSMKITNASFAWSVFLALVCVGLVLFLAGFVKLIIFSTKDLAT